jgi:hypothetical protein
MRIKQVDVREYEGIARTLEMVAKNYPQRSAEHKAIELAVKALILPANTQSPRNLRYFGVNGTKDYFQNKSST